MSDSKLCANCQTVNGAFKCSKCRAVRYCGPACQREHWPQHLRTCLDALCFVCGDTATEKCTRCDIAVYCSDQCRTAHWTRGGHESNCTESATCAVCASAYAAVKCSRCNYTRYCSAKCMDTHADTHARVCIAERLHALPVRVNIPLDTRLAPCDVVSVMPPRPGVLADHDIQMRPIVDPIYEYDAMVRFGLLQCLAHYPDAQLIRIRAGRVSGPNVDAVLNYICGARHGVPVSVRVVRACVDRTHTYCYGFQFMPFTLLKSANDRLYNIMSLDAYHGASEVVAVYHPNMLYEAATALDLLLDYRVLYPRNTFVQAEQADFNVSRLYTSTLDDIRQFVQWNTVDESVYPAGLPINNAFLTHVAYDTPCDCGRSLVAVRPLAYRRHDAVTCAKCNTHACHNCIATEGLSVCKGCRKMVYCSDDCKSILDQQYHDAACPPVDPSELPGWLERQNRTSVPRRSLFATAVPEGCLNIRYALRSLGVETITDASIMEPLGVHALLCQHVERANIAMLGSGDTCLDTRYMRDRAVAARSRMGPDDTCVGGFRVIAKVYKGALLCIELIGSALILAPNMVYKNVERLPNDTDGLFVIGSSPSDLSLLRECAASSPQSWNAAVPRICYIFADSARTPEQTLVLNALRTQVAIDDEMPVPTAEDAPISVPGEHDLAPDTSVFAFKCTLCYTTRAPDRSCPNPVCGYRNYSIIR